MTMKESGPDYFDNLTHSVGTMRLLLEKAHKDGALIEGLCLYVSIIDAFLRLAIIYTRTQKAPDHTYEFDGSLIHQGDGDRALSEKEIYSLAHKEGILSQGLYERLQKMYLFRNKVVHRFALSDITYDEVGHACGEFEKIFQEIFEILVVLEHGPHGIREPGQAEKSKIFSAIKRKLGEAISKFDHLSEEGRSSSEKSLGKPNVGLME